MKNEMRSLYQISPEVLELRTNPIPSPLSHEVLIRLRSVGICGSDVHYFIDGRIGDQRILNPHILGHEAVGEIAETGAKVSWLKKGDRVAVEPAIPCGKCELCLHGKPNLCQSVVFLGTPPVSGAFQEYIVMPGENCLLIPEELGFDEAVLAEPLAIALYGVRHATFSIGDTSAIFGGGPIGLSVLFTLLSAGSSQTILTELVSSRATMASTLGANLVLMAQETDPVKEILAVTDGKGVDVAYECAGSQETLTQAVESVCCGGKVVIFGIPPGDDVKVDPHLIRRKEVTIYNVRRSAFTTPVALAMIKQSPLFQKLITHRFPLDRASEGFQILSGYKDGVIKAVVHP